MFVVYAYKHGTLISCTNEKTLCVYKWEPFKFEMLRLAFYSIASISNDLKGCRF